MTKIIDLPSESVEPASSAGHNWLPLEYDVKDPYFWICHACGAMAAGDETEEKEVYSGALVCPSAD